ncbi:DUF3095 family protein [Methylobacterium persicinum]|uniref:Adenylate cyclase n=1 Tax=Methylobacterium persicinum TaxID=374426 RepID=A0ABU0HKK5_9HYPH|nr:DUF3095 family protein [Methylobacterium persicinum]MDQ0442061.1 hypothetical protein [Methylobacterium persicinum]GJE38840.1 hypothetical protein KHHGKMAE_2915 [Methylobacterium persicinum]
MPDPRVISAISFDYTALTPIDRFQDVLDDSRYVPVPDSWWIAVSDVVMSTAAIEGGRYRAVNLAGAAAITAIRNALPDIEIPFAFGGDGASLLIPPDRRATVERALAKTVAWVRDALQLTLRAALIPVSAVRAAGQDLRIARYGASADVAYAMFTGGGLAWAEAAMKAGLNAVAPAEDGSRPDLNGLSCRFEPVASRGNIVLSLIVLPRQGADAKAVRTVLESVLAAIEAGPGMGRPLPDGGPSMRLPWSGLTEDAAAADPVLGSRILRRLLLLGRRAFSYAVFRFGLTVGRFSPRTYSRQLVANADFRKYGDGLRLTVASPPETVERIEALLAAAKAEGLVSYGLHCQDAAVVTCITPSPIRADHLHFVDGAGGGYARAALDIKRAAE